MNEEFFINLIYKKISGEITPNEKGELNEWLSESKENQLIAQSVELAWENSDSKIKVPDVDLDKEFSSLEECLKEDLEKDSGKIQFTPNKKRSLKQNKRILWLSAAASIALLLTIGYILKQQFTTDQLTWIEVVTKDDSKKIELADNSTIVLNKNSLLRYPEKFVSNNRKVELTGEAFFDISHNPKKPFIINTKQEEIKILGTSFNVRAYENELLSSVYVTSGKVQFSPINSSDNIVLVKGNKGVFNRQNKELKKVEKASDNEISWHTKRLTFNDTPMLEVVAQAEKMYQVKFEIKNPKLNNCLFTSTFNNQEIEIFLETISTVLEIEVIKVNDKLYQLKGGNCE